MMIAPAEPSSRPSTSDRVIEHHGVTQAEHYEAGDGTVTRTVAKHPVAALTVAAVIGVSIGWIVKRRL